MNTELYSHQDYLAAFTHFMQTGDSAALANYTGGKRPAAFLKVYRNGFMRASVAALASNFPSVQQLWGDEYFSHVASAYVNVSPPASATLVGYGFTGMSDGSVVDAPLSFIDFLQQHQADLVKRYPYVLDVCRLDQAWLQVLNAASSKIFTIDEVQHCIAQGQDLSLLPMRLVDSAYIVSLEFDIFELWGQLRFGSLAEDQQIELAAQENSVIFWQRDLQVQAKPLSATEAVFMQHLNKFADFDAATQQATMLDETFDVSTLFAELLNAHLLTIQ